MAKRYYWLKLKNDFFDSIRIKKLRGIAGGDTYTIIYLKLLLYAIDKDGIIEYEGIEKTISEELALVLDETAEDIGLCINYLSSVGLAEVRTDSILLPEAVENVGSETASTQRVRDYRERQKALHCNTDVTGCNADETEVKHIGNVEKEIEKEIDIEIEKEIEKDSSVEAEPEYLEPLNYNMEVLDGVSEEGKRYEEEVLLPAEEKKHTIFPAEELESTITELAPVESVILNDNSEWIPTVEEYEEYKRLYPNVDIDQEFRKIHGWCKDNPKKRKTRTGVKRFVGGWLSREQDKPRAGNSVPSWKRQDTLSDFYNADPDRQGSGEKVTDDDIAEFQKMLSQMSGS